MIWYVKKDGFTFGTFANEKEAEVEALALNTNQNTDEYKVIKPTNTIDYKGSQRVGEMYGDND